MQARQRLNLNFTERFCFYFMSKFLDYCITLNSEAAKIRLKIYFKPF